MNLEELKREYATQDNRATAYPLYVWVEELRMVASYEPEDEPNGHFDHEEEIEDDDGNKRIVVYKYFPVELFLTVRGAQEYIEADRHNLFKPRTWIGHFNRRNREMRGLLKAIEFRTED